MAAKYTHAQYLQRVLEVHGNKVKVIGRYKSSQIKLEHRCVNGHTWIAVPGSVLMNKDGCCKLCRDDITRAVNTSNRRTRASFVKALAASNPTLKFLDAEISTRIHTNVHCNICKTTYSTLPGNAIGFGCPACWKLRRSVSTEDYQLKLDAKYQKTIKATATYKDSKTKISHKCTKCSNTWNSIPNYMLTTSPGCPSCSVGTKRKFRTRGKTFYVMGYEAQAIEWILNNTTVKASQIVTPSDRQSTGLPVIEYVNKGKMRKHYPDIYIPDKNILVEVKSTATAGLVSSHYGNQKALFNSLKLKSRAAVASGFKYRVLVMSQSGNRIPLPVNWADMTLLDVVKAIGL